MDLHAIPGRGPVREALRAGRELLALLVDDRSARDVAELADQARAAGVTVQRVTGAELDAAARGVLHQGVVAHAPPFSYAPLDAVVDGDLIVVLDGVTDPQNLGAIARSAEAAGAAALVTRERRGAGVTAAAEKAAAGALSWLPVVVVTNLVRALAQLASAGLWSVGLVGDAGEPLWESTLLDGRVVLVVGSEGSGLSRLTQERVDTLVRIPMSGHMASLNASAAAAVALFEVQRRRRPRGA